MPSEVVCEVCGVLNSPTDYEMACLIRVNHMNASRGHTARVYSYSSPSAVQDDDRPAPLGPGDAG